MSSFEVVHLHRLGHPQSLRYRYSGTKHKYSQSSYPAASSTFSSPFPSPRLRTYVHRWIGLYSVPRSSLHYFSAPRRCKRACKSGRDRGPVTLVTYTRRRPPLPLRVSSGSSHGMHKSEIVARDDDDEDKDDDNALSTPCVVLSRNN